MGYAVSLVKESEVMTIQKDYTPLIKKTLKRQYLYLTDQINYLHTVSCPCLCIRQNCAFLEMNSSMA